MTFSFLTFPSLFFSKIHFYRRMIIFSTSFFTFQIAVSFFYFLFSPRSSNSRDARMPGRVPSSWIPFFIATGLLSPFISLYTSPFWRKARPEHCRRRLSLLPRLSPIFFSTHVLFLHQYFFQGKSSGGVERSPSHQSLDVLPPWIFSFIRRILTFQPSPPFCASLKELPRDCNSSLIDRY